MKDTESLSIVVQWDAVDDFLFTTYTITWISERDDIQVATLIEQISYTITGLTVNTEYTITVAADNICGQGSQFSKTLSLFIDTSSTINSASPNTTITIGAITNTATTGYTTTATTAANTTTTAAATATTAAATATTAAATATTAAATATTTAAATATATTTITIITANATSTTVAATTTIVRIITDVVTTSSSSITFTILNSTITLGSEPNSKIRT